MCRFRLCGSTRYRDVLSSPPSIGVTVSVPTHINDARSNGVHPYRDTNAHGAEPRPTQRTSHVLFTETHVLPIHTKLLGRCLPRLHTSVWMYEYLIHTPSAGVTRRRHRHRPRPRAALSGSPMELPTPLHTHTYSVREGYPLGELQVTLKGCDMYQLGHGPTSALCAAERPSRQPLARGNRPYIPSGARETIEPSPKCRV